MAKLSRWVLGMLLSLGTAALAAEDPEAVYGKLHRATLEGNVNEVLSYATAARRAEMAPLPGKEDMVRMMASALPRTYSITSKTISPNGRAALLQARGVHETLGPARATVQLFKEQGEWKVDEWSWAPLLRVEGEPEIVRVQASAAPLPSKPASSEEESKAPMAAQPIEPVVAKPVEAPTLRKATEANQPCVVKPVMSDEDLRRCGATPPKY